MATEMIRKEIEGSTYEFSQFGAKKSLKVLMRLTKIVGKPLSLLVGSVEGDKSKSLLDRDMKMDAIALAIEALTNSMDSDEVISLIQELTGHEACMCDGKKINFDMHYEGRLPHLFKVLWAALEVQYGNFFDALSASPAFAKNLTTKSE